MSNLLTARKPLIWQPQQPAYPSKGGGLAVGLNEVIVPHTRLSAVRRLPNVSRGTGIKPIQTPGGIALGCTAFANNGTVAPLDWPHHGFRLTPPFTIGAVVFLNSSSTINFPNMFSSNNSGWRLRAGGGQFIADVTRSGATVTVTDATVQTLGTVHVLMFVVTASTIELFVDGVSVGSAAHSSYSAGGNATVAVSSLSSGGVQNAGGTLQLASWTRACTLADAVAYARNPWAVLEDDEETWFAPAAGGVTIDCTPGNAVAAGASCTFDVSLSCTSGNATATGVECTVEVGGDVVIDCEPGNAIAAGVLCTIETGGIAPPQSGSSGAGYRVRRSREFNDFIEGLFKKKTRRQTLQAVVAQAVDEEKLQQGIEFVAEAFRQKEIQKDFALRAELELTEVQLRKKLQELEEEEFAVVSLLL